MPKYFAEKIFGHWLYFTTHCILEAMHVHASRDSKLREGRGARQATEGDKGNREWSVGWC